MPDAVCVKAGSIDDKAVRDFKTTSVEFYCKDRMGYQTAVEGAEQKPVSFRGFLFLVSVFVLDFVGGKRRGGVGGFVAFFFSFFLKGKKKPETTPSPPLGFATFSAITPLPFLQNTDTS